MTNDTPARLRTEDPQAVAELTTLAEEAEALEEQVQTLAMRSEPAILRYETCFEGDLTDEQLAPATRLLNAITALQRHLAGAGGAGEPGMPDWRTET